MKMKATLFFIACTILFIGCRKDKADGSIPDLTMHLFQKPDSLGGALIMDVHGGSYDYSNVLINYSLSQSGNSISLEFINTYCPGDYCHENTTSSASEATAYIKMGDLANGNYSLEIKTPKKTYTGTLTITTAAYAIILSTDSHLKFYLNRNSIYRIQASALYGSIKHYGTTPISSYLDSLVSIGVGPCSFPAGDYGNLAVYANGSIYSTESGGDSTFMLTYSGNFNLIKNISQYYKDSLHVYANLKDGKGNHFP